METMIGNWNFNPGASMTVNNTAGPTISIIINNEPALTITKDGELQINEDLLHYGTIMAKIQNNLNLTEGELAKLNPDWRMDVVKAILRRVLTRALPTCL